MPPLGPGKLQDAQRILVNLKATSYRRRSTSRSYSSYMALAETFSSRIQVPTMESIDNSEISEWYRDKTVFLTGGTGFMGKVLVEKLLRSCPVKKIFLLMRPKANNDINQRIDDMLNYKFSDRKDNK
ncbi:hypothetical protein HAZT_HAZT006742 [Hyalella azteca]|uniref:Fatty acyl-CoA reductase n=1 Tax=Hyalella azteca TaxID=294128 RepID=A0A6A0HDG5_HYAAZ|nr:hypothetical protein HAZT_HAZT006742 [Hyalella azteca]